MCDFISYINQILENKHVYYSSGSNSLGGIDVRFWRQSDLHIYISPIFTGLHLKHLFVSMDINTQHEAAGGHINTMSSSDIGVNRVRAAHWTSAVAPTYSWRWRWPAAPPFYLSPYTSYPPVIAVYVAMETCLGNRTSR